MNIGFFDTGLGGATIFKEIYNSINANYFYLADTKNSPYGTKDFETVKNLTIKNISKLIDLNCKIIIIACNTATSCSIKFLREEYKDIIFIGTEPAIKPALENSGNKKILLTATSLTLNGNKLKNLISNLNCNSKIEYLALDNLVQFADNYNSIQYDLAKDYIQKKFSNYNFSEFSGIVLGCTHFPIFKDVIKQLVPGNIQIYDSSIGIKNKLNQVIFSINNNYNEQNKKFKLLLSKESNNFLKKFMTLI